jgi:addiction module HigA family antidote
MGELLQTEFMAPSQLSANALAQALNVPVAHIQDLLHDRRKITVDTSMRLGRLFGVSDDYFLKLQTDIDLRKATT